MPSDRILVIDDEPGVREALAGVLGDEGFRVETVETGEDGLERLAGEDFDAVLLDVWLPGIDGLETLRRVRERDQETEIVMISGHGTIETAVRATKLGAFDFVEKPLSLDRTLLVLRNALRQRRLRRVNRQLMRQLDRDTEICGLSAASDELRRQVARAAGSAAPVLVCGVPGSGRENVARRIHNLGEHAAGPFVELPLGALAQGGAERALFGASDDPGRLALAVGGTVYLEDVDALTPELQRRLAATLRDGERREDAPRRIASARRGDGLESELSNRLDVLRLEIPPLRDRVEDVPVLAQRFLDELREEYGRGPERFSEQALERMTDYAWPGEVRELKNLVEQLTLSSRAEAIEADDLPDRFGGPSGDGRSVDLYGNFATLREGLAAFERYYVRKVLDEADGELDVAAERLGLTPGQVKRRAGKRVPAQARRR